MTKKLLKETKVIFGIDGEMIYFTVYHHTFAQLSSHLEIILIVEKGQLKKEASDASL